MERTSHDSPVASEVRLRQAGQFVVASPAVLPLRHGLQTVRHVPFGHPDHPFCVVNAPVPLLKEEGHGKEAVATFWSGLEPVARQALLDAGYHVRPASDRKALLPEPVLTDLPALSPVDLWLLRLVQQHDRGLIRYQPVSVDPAWLIAQIALAWKHLKIAIVVTRIDEARQLRDRLRKWLPDVVAVTSRNRLPDELVGRVVVTTHVALGHTGVAVEWRDILIAVNGAESICKEARYCISHACRARLYGFLDATAEPAPHDRDLIRALYGFQEVVVPRHGHEHVHVDVFWCRHGGGCRLPFDLPILDLKRRGLWRDEVRNRRIARLARLLKAQDVGGLAAHFPRIAATWQPSQQPSVVVLVETVEHGHSLARHLPDWLLIAGSETFTAGLSGERLSMRPSCTRAVSSLGFGAVVTFTGLAQLALENVDVVLRADGGMGLPPAIGGLSREITYGKNNLPHLDALKPSPGLLLVDIDDRHHPGLRRWSRWRRTAYRQHGWYGPGVDPVQVRVEDFLASRPKR